MTDPARAAEAWFLEHGLPYFVDDVRRRCAPASRVPRVVLVLLVALAVAGAAGLAVGLASGSVSFGLAVGAWVLVGMVAAYALFALRMHASPAGRCAGPSPASACSSRWPPARCRC